MEPSIDGVRAKLRRAQMHLSSLNSRIADFKAANPVSITVDRDGGQNAFIFRVWDVVPADPEWALILGDCVHNARSSLDHLAFQLAALNLGRDLDDAEARRVQFPIARDPSEFNKAKSRIRDLRPTEVQRIEQIQPYNGWDESVWGQLDMPGPPAPIALYLDYLHQLDIADKHRAVHPVWMSAAISRLPQAARVLGVIGSSTTASPIKDGDEIGRWHFRESPPAVPDEMTLHIADYFPVHVSLREPHFATGLSRILANCVTAVGMVVDMFEPCLVTRASPAPLRYWDAGPPWL